MPQSYCPICGNHQLEHLFSLPNIPVVDNVLAESIEEAKNVMRGTQSLTQCRHCGFVFNRDFDKEKVQYNDNYHAERGQSSYYNHHIQYVISLINAMRPLKGARVLEVACGTGEFLRELAPYSPQSCIGVDPGAPTITDGSLVFNQAFFDESYLKSMPCPADILINRHMIEHIQNPLEMLHCFNRALSPTGILYLETPRLDWILQHGVFYDFPYEHCAYYTDDFMMRLLKMAGFSITQMEHTYEGQYFSIYAEKNKDCNFEPVSLKMLDQVRNDFSKMSQIYNKINGKIEKSKFPKGNFDGRYTVHQKNTYGIYFWGAAAKGVMCANLLTQIPIAGFIDKNPNKQAKFIPGTGHPILAPTEIAFDHVKVILVENDVYYQEIRQEVQRIDSRIQVFSLNQFLQE